MRNKIITLTINNPKSHVVDSIHPISRGPYSGHDLLLLMDDLCGSVYVVRAKTSGEHIYTSELVPQKEGMALIQKMRNEQSNKDCDAVTGGGRWGCD